METISGFAKTVVYGAVLLSIGACYSNLCEEDEDCWNGSFCLKTSGEGVCTWGEWTADASGNWGILPKLELSTSNPIQDSDNPRFKTVETPNNGRLQLHMWAYGASSLPVPSADERVSVECEEAIHARRRSSFYRQCDFRVRQVGDFRIQIDAENENGKNSRVLLWRVTLQDQG